jgi:hypothetical protein
MTDYTLAALNSIPLWDHRNLGEVEFMGGADPILPTSFRIGSAAAASLAAVGMAVTDLWESRTGKRQQIKVNSRRATASLRSSRYMTLNGAPAAGERNAVMGVYPARNGRWSYLHCNFPNHREAALQVLGVGEDKEAVRRAVANWDALELEEAIIAARGGGRHGPQYGRMGQAPPIGGSGLPAVTGNRQDWRRPAAAHAGRTPASFRHTGVGPDPGLGRPHLRPNPG